MRHGEDLNRQFRAPTEGHPDLCSMVYHSFRKLCFTEHPQQKKRKRLSENGKQTQARFGRVKKSADTIKMLLLCHNLSLFACAWDNATVLAKGECVRFGELLSTGL